MSALLPFLAKDELSVSQLEQWYAVNRSDPGLPDAAISAMAQLDSEIAWRAVWMLRRITKDAKLTSDQVARICEAAPSILHWAWRLTLCQLLARTGIPPTCREDIFPFLADCFRDRRTIVRAWALSAMMHCKADRPHRAHVAAAFRSAQRDRSPSMRARLRHLAGYQS